MTDHLDRSIDLALESVARGGGPFGSVIVTADGQVFEGCNDIPQTNDPTAHAEIQALRAACAAVGSPELPGAVVYASGEPCPMCWAALHWAKVERVIYAAGGDQATAAGFDASWITREPSPIEFVHEPRPRDNAPFETRD